MPVVLKGKKDNIELKPSSNSIELKPSTNSIELKPFSNSIELKPSSSSIELQVPVSSGAVSSVNGQTGNVVIDVPSKVSELENDAGYLTEHQSLDALATKEALNNGLAAKQDKLTAGENITIQNNVISASGSGGSSYTLPQASYSRLGGVKVVSNTSPYNNSDIGRITISDDGVLYINDELDEQPKYASDGKQYALLFIGKHVEGPANLRRNPYIRRGGALYPLPFRAGTAINISNEGTISVDTTQVSANNGVPSGGGYPQILIKNTVKDYDTSWGSLPDLLNYYSIGSGSDWNITTSIDEGNLYNAKEVVIFWQDSNYNYHQTYLNVGSDYNGNNGQTWGSSSWMNTSIYLDSYDEYNGAYIMYDGSSVNSSNCSINAICYKT